MNDDLMQLVFVMVILATGFWILHPIIRNQYAFYTNTFYWMGIIALVVSCIVLFRKVKK